MNFLLQHLELHVDETFLLQGERLLEGGKVSYYAEQERNLWVATVEAGRPYEIEVKISPSRVTAATCECERYLETGMCGHIVATLLQVRKEQAARKEAREKNRQAAPPRRQKLSPDMILEAAPNDDLLAFVRDYARQDRAFGLALKARFAGLVTSINSSEKYAQIIDSAISMARKADRTLNKKGAQQLSTALHELLSQAEDHCARELYAEAMYIAQAIIEKIPPVMNKAVGYELALRGMVEQSLDLLHQLAQTALSPALREQLWHYCLEEFGRITHRIHQLDDRFFRIMMDLSSNAKQRKQLLDWLEEHLNKYATEGRDPSTMALLKVEWAERIVGKAQFFKMAEQHANLPSVLRYFVERSLELEEPARARKLVEQVLKTTSQKDEVEQLEEMLLKIALRENDATAIAKYAQKRFVATLQNDYWQLVREHTTGDRLLAFEQILEALHRLPTTPQKWQAIANVYASEERYEELIAYLQRSNSIELLAQFDHLLLPNHKEELSQMYRILLLQYLKNHIGYRPSRRIRELLDHLAEIGAPDLAVSLVSLFKASYPERQSLMEELKSYGR